MITSLRFAATGIAALALTATCTQPADGDAASPAAGADTQAEFWAALSTHCGKAYAGQLTSEDEADADFVGKAMVMQVRECSDTRIAIPFHIETEPGVWDRSRTWLITKTDAGLRLKHDHRHEDGEEDAVTMYGGDTADAGTAMRQEFPVDAESIALFERPEFDGAYCASIVNTWSVEVDPAGSETPTFAYTLTRPIRMGRPKSDEGSCEARYLGRTFRVEFDLANEVEAPPAAWGQV